MTRTYYDSHAFLHRMTALSYDAILREAESECTSVERTLSGVKGAPKRREQGGGAYVTKIKKFLFFLRSGTHQGGASPDEFQAYKPVVESLVKRGEFRAEALTLFSGRQHGEA